MISISITSWMFCCICLVFCFAAMGTTYLLEWKTDDWMPKVLTITHYAIALCWFIKIIYDLILFG